MTKDIAWTARVEWPQATSLSTDDLERLVERLLPYAGALGVEKEAAGPDEPETWSAVINVDAPSLRQATTAALQAVEQAVGAKATGIEVLTEHEHQRRTMRPTIPELVGYAEIAEMAGVTRQRARTLAENIGFPMAVVETAAGPLRVRAQVEAWLRTWERRSGRPPKVVSEASS